MSESERKNDIIRTIKKRLSENKEYLHFNVDMTYISDIENMLSETNYQIIYIDKLFFTADLFLKRCD